MEGKGKFILFGCLGLGCFTSICAGALLFVMFQRGKLSNRSDSSPSRSSQSRSQPVTGPTDSGVTLRTSRFQFTDEAGQVDTGGDYGVGEKVYYVFFVEGVALDAEGKWNLRVHLKVTTPNGRLLLDKDVVNQPGDIAGPLRISGYVELPQGVPTGSYTLATTTEDLVAGTVLPETRTFRVAE